MNANELMIGDLVRVNHDGLCIRKDSIVNVRGIDADDKLAERGLIGSAHCRPLDNDQFEGGIWCEYLEPIPLTPEILEKNGFGNIYKDDYYTHFYLGTEHICENSELHIGTSNDGIYWLNNYNNAVYWLRYVHELQHALRLCGIEKEIEL